MLSQCEGCGSEEKDKLIKFHGREVFMKGKLGAFESVIDRTKKLAKLDKLNFLENFKIANIASYPTENLYRTAVEKKRFNADTIHIFIGATALYDLNRNHIIIPAKSYEDESTILHEIFHHRLKDKENIFPHYSDSSPKCGQENYWCFNIMSESYTPFGFMTTANQNSTIIKNKVNQGNKYYCKEKNSIPPIDTILAYQDSLKCCDLSDNLNNCEVFLTEITGRMPNSLEVTKCQQLRPLIVDLYTDNESAFCPKYLQRSIILSLKDHLASISILGDPQSNEQFAFKIDNQLISDDSIVLQAYIDKFLFERLNDSKITRIIKEEAKFLSSIYDEDSEDIFARNMGHYQMDVLVKSLNYYKKENIATTLNKNRLLQLREGFLDGTTNQIDNLKGFYYLDKPLYLSSVDLSNVIQLLE